MEASTSDITTASLEMPSELRYLRTLRLTTASLLTSWDLDVELIEDVRVAVTEACTLLWRHHGRAGSVQVDYRFDGSTVRVELHLSDASPEQVRAGSLNGSSDLGNGIAETLIAHLTARHFYQPEERKLTFEVRR